MLSLSLIRRHALRWSPTLVVFALTACDRLDNFSVPVSGSGTIQKATLVDELLGSFNLSGFDNISFSQSFANQGVTNDNVDSVILETFKLSVTAPSSANFDFIQSLKFYANADGLPEVEIAELTTIPQGAHELDLVIDDVELKPYAVAPKMTVRAEVTGKKPSTDVQVKADASFDVDIHIPGCN